MAEVSRNLDPNGAGTVWLVRKTQKLVAQATQDLGINDGMFATASTLTRHGRGEADSALVLSERAALWVKHTKGQQRQPLDRRPKR